MMFEQKKNLKIEKSNRIIREENNQMRNKFNQHNKESGELKIIK